MYMREKARDMYRETVRVGLCVYECIAGRMWVCMYMYLYIQRESESEKDRDRDSV